MGPNSLPLERGYNARHEDGSSNFDCVQCFAENLTPFNSTYDLACSTAPNVIGSYRPAQTNSSNVQQIGNVSPIF